MKGAVNLERATWGMVIVSALTWVLFAMTTSENLSEATDFLGLVPRVVTVDAAVVALFAARGWRWPVWQGWLVERPDLNGTWLGELRSDYVSDGERIAPIPAMLTIRQSLFSISCVIRTAEMRSDSYAEGFRIDSDRQLKQLAYSYSSVSSPLVRDRSSSHDGTAVLDIILSPDRRLRGRYWTERRRMGEMEFTFHERGLLEELPTDTAPHPMRATGADR